MTCRAWTLKEFDRTALKELTAAIAEQNTEELEQNALDDEPWSEQKYAATLAAQQKEAGLLAGVLAARGITDPTEALTLLAGEEELSDPMLLTDMDKACARILEAIDKEQTIVVYGDYDVDGVTATAFRKTPCSPSTTRAVSSSSRWTTASPRWKKPTLRLRWAWTSS